MAKIKVVGRWHLPKKGPYIIACNHFSYVDPAFFKYAIQKPICFLAASDQEIEKHFMWFVFLYGFIPIDRQNLAPSTIKLAKQVLKVIIEAKASPSSSPNPTCVKSSQVPE